MTTAIKKLIITAATSLAAIIAIAQFNKQGDYDNYIAILGLVWLGSTIIAICLFIGPRVTLCYKSFSKRGGNSINRNIDMVTYDDTAITRTRPDGVEESIKWTDLSEVGIVTTDEGPFEEDIFLILLNSDGTTGCAVPQLSKGFQELLIRLQTLPGFDNEAVIRAMGCTSNNRFLLWKPTAG